MEPDIMNGLTRILGLMIPMFAISIVGVLVLSRTRIGEAIARRISGDARDTRWEAELEALEDEVARLRGQLGETNERLDFAERLLTRGEEDRRKA
jgi:ubiquinone biosynthesis protein UbiJ